MLEQDTDGKAEGPAPAGMQDSGNPSSTKPKLTFKRFLALAKAFEYRQFAKNFPMWLWLKVRNSVFFWFMRMRVRWWARKSKILQVAYRRKWKIKMWLAGYRWIHPEAFIKLYPPKDGHKKCGGKGWYILQRPTDKKKMIVMCDCVQQKYKASGKKWLLKEMD